MKFSGNNVLVTGGSRGIGAEICKTLANFGLKVWINYRSKPEVADTLKDEIEKNGGNAAVIKFDATNETEFIEAINLIVQTDGELSYLVNNAGITKDNLIIRMKESEFDQVIKINLKGAFNCLKAVTPIMLKQRSGKIVNMSSVVGVIGNPGQVNYCASKAGLIGMTKSLAREIGVRGINVNAIAPGFIDTDMTRVLTEEQKKNILSQIPLNKFGNIEDIANTALFLASENSNYITGQVIHIDGGMAM